MPNPLRSYDDHLSQESLYGDWRWCGTLSTRAPSTAATTTSGFTTTQRFPETVTVPTMGAPVTRAYCVFGAVQIATASTFVAAIETTLGTLTVSGNSFASGSAMPSRKIATGESLSTAATECYLVATVALSATTPVVTITYTNAEGVGSRTATLTLPTGVAVNSAFDITPHLQSGDTGVSSVQNISISTGTAGTLRVYGLLPLYIAPVPAAQGTSYMNPSTLARDIYGVESGDVIGFYRHGSTSSERAFVHLVFAPES